MTKTSVVILNYNGEDLLRKFLPIVTTHTENAEVIVADNASTDSSMQLLSDEFKHLRLIELEKNFGFAGGYNQALKEIESEYFVLLNSDVEVTKNWLHPLVDFLDANPDYAAVQPKMKDYGNKDLFEYAGACGGFLDTLGYPYCRGRLFYTVEADNGQYDSPTQVFWASGACLVIRSKVFFEAGGFDEDFFAHMEEIDLCWRLHSLGYKIGVVPNSEVYHVGGGTLNKVSPFKTYLNHRNGLFLLIKNLPRKQLFGKVLLRIILDWIAMLKLVLEGRLRHAISIIKAHHSMMLQMKTTMAKRDSFSPIPTKLSIVKEYFLKGKRNFSEL